MLNKFERTWQWSKHCIWIYWLSNYKSCDLLCIKLKLLANSGKWFSYPCITLIVQLTTQLKNYDVLHKLKNHVSALLYEFLRFPRTDLGVPNNIHLEIQPTSENYLYHLRHLKVNSLTWLSNLTASWSLLEANNDGHSPIRFIMLSLFYGRYLEDCIFSCESLVEW